MQGNISSRNKRRMCYFNSSNDMWLRTLAKSSKVQISHSYMWAADVFITKPVTTDMFIFKEKYQKKISRKYHASLQKKEFLVLIKKKTVI